MKILIKAIRNHHRQRIPCIVIESDKQKYFFNAPEGLQRFVKYYSLKFRKKLRLFFTGTSPHHLTGVVGLSLTLFE